VAKVKSSKINHLKTSNSQTISDQKNIADCLAQNFSKNSSSTNYSKQFQNFKKQQEKTKLNFKSNNDEKYNAPFTLQELRESLDKSHDTACGPDQIHYQLLKHLPDTSLLVLLSIYNRIWENGELPPSWKEATIIPIAKPGKDASDPSNYRPIALTSCVCKTLERMINNRLVWFLESNNLISNFQSGFRTRRSTNDHLVRLETFIRDAFIKKEHLVAVFFDMEKAYDTTWKYGIMKDLEDIGLKGRLPSFICNFLSDRNFKVRVGSTLSDSQNQEEGVPQGSILSVTLFGLKINNIVKCLSPGVDCSLYVDDFLICYRSKNMHTIERQLQQCLNKLDTWSNENGFKFSPTKTQCVHFCQLKKRHDDPVLKIGNTQIPVVDQAKFLGVIFDKRLSFVPHIKALRTKCLKALNLIRVLAHTDWGADRKVLLRLYRSLIRSKLDYGCIVYGSARKSYLQMLDTIHHQGLRLALGAFRTSPVESILTEANEPSLYLRRERLSLNFATQVKSNPNNPANEALEPKYEELFDNKPKAIRPFSLRLKTSISNSDLNLDTIKDHAVPDIPPWTVKQPDVLFRLHNDNKSDTSQLEFQSNFSELKSQYPDHIAIYTDGSKEGARVGCASVSHLHTSKLRLPDNSSIFSAEVKAIDLAFRFISSQNHDKFIIFSDSLSVLQSLNGKKFTNPLIQDLLIKHDHLSSSKKIVFCWLPSHVGIGGNEEADKAAKLSLGLNESRMKIPYTDFRPSIHNYIISKWQASWNNTLFNKLFMVKPCIGECPSSYRSVRREEVILARCRIGHTRLTHSYLLQREEQPECVFCLEPLTVKHLLLDCVDLADVRQRFFSAGSMHELFNTVTCDNIISFLKETGLYSRF
jgi:ribonuclease HI